MKAMSMTDLFDPWTDRLSEYLDGELDAGERAALDEHLRHCAGCRRVLADLREVKRRAAALRDRDPRPELWTEIATRIGAPGVELPSESDELAARRRRKMHTPWLAWGTGIAAVLALGIGIGRLTAPATPTLSEVTVEAPAPGTPLTADPYRVAAVAHLTRTESLLTAFRADAGDGRADPQVAAWADDLLANTRLLLDSPAADDPRLRSLLEDLELVLVQISQLSPSNQAASGAGAGGEVELANEALEERRVLPRLRTMVPAGPTFRAQGES